MQLALECRTDLLSYIQPFSDFDWIQVREALTDRAYMDFYKSSSVALKFVSGFTADKKPVSTDEILKVQKETNATYVVVPTLDKYIEFTSQLGQGRVMGILQGRTFTEVLTSSEAYGAIVAVPYSICSQPGDSPQTMALKRALIVCNLPSEKVVHLMGFLSLDEFYWYQGRPNVVSINTGIPILLGLEERQILEPLEEKGDTYQQMKGLKLTQKGWTAICQNLALLRKYMP